MKKQRHFDSVRASRDGHEYHEAWTARKTLQLLLPTDNLIAIAVEGLQSEEQSTAAHETNEIADIVLYYGRNHTFDDSEKVKITQFKYSTKSEISDFRASDAKKTIKKFSTAFMDYLSRYNAKSVKDKLEFELITNRPIYEPFYKAMENIFNGKISSPDKQVNVQIKQFIQSSGLKGTKLFEFAGKCSFIGLTGNLSEIKKGISRILVDWSAGNDARAKVCLGSLKQLIRDKAGSAGYYNNIIKKVDILATLELQDVNELLPCPASLPDVGRIVQREQLSEARNLIKQIDKPLLIHASGGMGKTVFLESLSKSLSTEYEVLFFDCFGGGAYRSPEDSRHLPNRGLIHIINTLAVNGFCDPILPGNHNQESLIRYFRQRLSQSVNTLSRLSNNRGLIIFIDAIDNAYIQAKDRNEQSFPLIILESLSYSGQIPGVKFVFSCRTYRISASTNDIPCREFELKPFTLAETSKYLYDRIPDVTELEIHVAQARSEGNPRILEHLVTSNRGLLDHSEINKLLELDDLLKSRIEDALRSAISRGYTKAELSTFLAGLTILPPPVPIEEYAIINNIDVSIIESFAADLAPLLERTQYGLIFRDEPTETLIKENQGSNLELLRIVANNLLKQQGNSVYATKALPALLYKIGDGERLFKLAFDERFPSSINSTVGRRNIRYARLIAATMFAATRNDYNSLVHLLLELSTITSVDQRGIEYILEAPDIVVAVNDIDAMRRLFETRTSWPGTRHTRLTIVNTLSDDLEAANRHAVSSEEWINHYITQKPEPIQNNHQPDHIDIAAIPFCLISQNRINDALNFVRIWKDWYAYEVSEYLFGFLTQLVFNKPGLQKYIGNLLYNTDKEIGLMASALSHLELHKYQSIPLIKKLSKALQNKKLEFREGKPDEYYTTLPAGLRKSIAVATSLGLNMEAKSICRRIRHKRPNIWCFRDHYALNYIVPFLENTALLSAINNNVVNERDILPLELYKISAGIKSSSGNIYKIKLKKRLEIFLKNNPQSVNNDRNVIRHDQKQEIEYFIDYMLDPLLSIVRSFSSIFSCTSSKEANIIFLEIVNNWEDAYRKVILYGRQDFHNFFQSLGCELLLFSLWTRSDISIKSARVFIGTLNELRVFDIQIIIRLVSIMAKRKHLQELAGEQAIIANSLIEVENDVSIRASHYIKLARAIMPADQKEAATYFKIGLEQMDAIGSGDFEFTNELLSFASSLTGNELCEKDSHTLTNICELNMSYEESKFPWASFAQGLTKVSGCKTLAKLSRWDDRSKITLNYTLLPYLSALVQQNKIDPEYALALNSLANPVELYSCNTISFAKEIANRDFKNKEDCITELIHQYESNNPRVQNSEILKYLAEISRLNIKQPSELTEYLLASESHYSKLSTEINEHNNSYTKINKSIVHKYSDVKNEYLTRLKELVNIVNPIDEAAIERAIEELDQIQEGYIQKEYFFESLFSKISYSDRARYIDMLSQLENLDLNIKLKALVNCKSQWSKSSSSLVSTFKDISSRIVQIHSDELIGFNQVWSSKLKEIADLTGVCISDLSVELCKSLLVTDFNVTAPIWLGIASIISIKSEEGEGQKALIRLLRSNTTKLASSVIDGEWKNGLYPSNNQVEVALGLVWRMLGSFRAEDRWRAAHSVRLFARFNKWELIDSLVEKYSTKHAHPFQAPELPFYYLHAQLWFMIALARISLDTPQNIAKYKQLLLNIVFDDNHPHVLIRHFASITLKNCILNGYLEVSGDTKKKINEINLSPFPRFMGRLKHEFDEFYFDRHKSGLAEKRQFNLDYDFEKYDVRRLSNIFGKASWEVRDIMSEIVNSLDPNSKSMYDKGGRDFDRRHQYTYMNSKFHGYGQYLGYHALFFAAGKLLNKSPITNDSYNDEPWDNWIKDNSLTRKDGLWLSDGIDSIPLELNYNLLETEKGNLVLTGNKNKILNLIKSNFNSKIEFTVCGLWDTPDQIKVEIDSIIINEKLAPALIKKLISEAPISVYLPSNDSYEEGYEYKNKDYIPWIIQPSREAKLDENDPFGNINAQSRPQFSEEIIKAFSISPNDPFKRTWKSKKEETVALSLAWGGNSNDGEDLLSGHCFLCSGNLLKKILTNFHANLIILVKLERYTREFGSSTGSFTHTIAVLRLTKNLELKYYKGAINKLHENRY